MRDLSEMPPTLRGWRVDLPPMTQDLFNRLFVKGYTFENCPDGSLIAHAPNQGERAAPAEMPRVMVAPRRFDHSNWAALGATPAQSRLIQANSVVSLAERQLDLREALAAFGWVYARQPDSTVMMAPGGQPRNMGTIGDITAPPPGVGPEVLFHWTTGQIPNPLPPGSRIEMRSRDTTNGPVWESRVVRDRPQGLQQHSWTAGSLQPPPLPLTALQAPVFPGDFRAMYQPLLREQHIGYLPVDGALTPYGETTEGRQTLEQEIQRMTREMDMSRALNGAVNRAVREPRADRGPRDNAVAGLTGLVEESPEGRRTHATAWLVNELRRRSNDPLQQDHKSFMVWAAEAYGEFMRKRDGEGNVDLRRNIPSQ